jgi:hypothetical protein
LNGSDSVLAEMSPDVIRLFRLNMNRSSVERQPGEKVSPKKLKSECRDLKTCVSLRILVSFRTSEEQGVTTLLWQIKSYMSCIISPGTKNSSLKNDSAPPIKICSTVLSTDRSTSLMVRAYVEHDYGTDNPCGLPGTGSSIASSLA